MTKENLFKALKGIIAIGELKEPESYVLAIIDPKNEKERFVVPMIRKEGVGTAYIDPSVYTDAQDEEISDIVRTLNEEKIFPIFKYTPRSKACKESYDHTVVRFIKPSGIKQVLPKHLKETLEKYGYTVDPSGAGKSPYTPRDYGTQVKDNPDFQMQYDAEKKMLEDSKASFETLPREVRLQYETVEAGAKDGILFVGPTGTGKTWISMALAVKAGAHREDIQITATTQPEDLIGSPAVDTRPDAQGKFRFIEGPLLKAYYLGYVISIQEVNYATFGANSCLNRFLDGTLQIEVNGTVYHRHPNFVAYLTMNAGYEDTNKLNKALKNRFTIVQIPPLTELEYCRRLANFSEYLGHRISDNFAKEIFKFSNVMQKIVVSAGWHESVDYSLRNATALLKTILLKNRNFEDFSLAVHSEYLNLLSCDNDNSLKLQEFKKSEEVVNYIKKLYEFYDFSEAEEAGDLDFDLSDLFKVEEKPEETKEEEKVMDDLYKRFDL